MTKPEFAEAIAVKEALSWIMQMKWPKVILESDCLIVIQAIRSKTPMRSRFGEIIAECRRHLQCLNNVELFFVKRFANAVAHELARAAYSYPDRIFDRSSVPIKVRDCIMADMSY